MMKKCFMAILVLSLLCFFNCASSQVDSSSKGSSSKTKTKKKSRYLEITSPLSGERIVARRISESSNTAYFVVRGKFSGLDPSKIYVFLKFPHQNVFGRASNPVTVVGENEWETNVFFGDDYSPAKVDDKFTIIAAGKIKESMKSINLLTVQDVFLSDWQKNITVNLIE